RRSRRPGARPAGPLPPGPSDRRRRGLRTVRGRSGRLDRGPGPRPRPAARRTGDGVPTEGVAGRAGGPPAPPRQAPRRPPRGRTASYADIARAIGAPKAVRAVAGACAANNLAVAIPCHRVVRNDGALSGYAWGVERKRALIEREAAA